MTRSVFLLRILKILPTMAAASAFPCGVIFLFVVICGVGCVVDKRNITISYNDGCNITECKGVNNTFNNLVHFRAAGNIDAIHYVWSSIGAPSLLMVRTSLKAALKVDWKKAVGRADGALSFEPADDVFSSSAFVIARLLEFNDTKDKADITQANVSTSIDLADLPWGNVTVNETTNTVNFSIKTGYRPAAENGTFSLVVKVLGDEGRTVELPHIQHQPNSTEFDLILDKLETNKTYTNARFAVEMQVYRSQLQGAPKPSGIGLTNFKSIDDEYTPAVFKTYRLSLSGSSASSQGSYMQWKPVVYTSPDRTTGDSKPTKVYDLNLTNHYETSYSMAQAYNWNMSQLEVGSFNISFGISGDDFYNASRYYVWSSTVGYGDAPKESISLLIISIISVGLGIPVILMIFGGIFVACKKRTEEIRADSLSKYSSINS